MNVVITVDPGNSYTGLAMLVEGHPEHARMARVCMFDGDVERSVRERVAPLLISWIMVARHLGCSRPTLLIERCPPTARKDAGHGKQAQIGFALGWLGGMIAGYLMAATMNAVQVELVDVGVWRKGLSDDPLFMKRVAPVIVAMPKTQRFEMQRNGNGGYIRVWAGCGHREVLPRWADIQHLTPPAKCPSCETATGDRAKIVRDEWKERACLYVERVYPDLLTEMVDEARATAMHKDKPVHELAGVADACEAMCMARYGIKKLGESVTEWKRAG